MMSSTLPLWIGVSLLYMLTAVYVHFTYRQIIDRSVPLAFLTFGAAIFIAVNRRIWFASDTHLLIAEGLIIAFVLMTWMFAIMAIHEFVAFHSHVVGDKHGQS